MANPFPGIYHFRSGQERKAYNNLPDADTQWAYICFAREKHAEEDARIAGHPRMKHKYRAKPFEVMREWRALATENRHLLVENAKKDGDRPDAMAVDIEEPNLSPGSIDDFVDTAGQDMEWARNTTWRYVKTLYNRESGYRKRKTTYNGLWSVVRLYVSVDDANRVRDFVVVKVYDWPVVQSSNFDVDGAVSSLESRLRLVESDLAKSAHILLPRAWRRSDYDYRPRKKDGQLRTTTGGLTVRITRRGIRSYADYCVYGDLGGVIDYYSWTTQATGDDIWKVPEKFIWHVFQSISLALRTLYKSKDDDEEEDADPADDVGYLGFLVHQDIKPNNIFLKDFDGDTYPQVVLGDFDAVKLADDIADRRLLGTEGYMAPEYYDKDEPISSRSDIWSIAGVIWDLMNSQRGFDNDENGVNKGLNHLRALFHRDIKRKVPKFQEPNYPSHHYIQEVLEHRDDLPKYTTWLTDLVQACSCHRPIDRKNIIDLVTFIEKQVANIELMTEGQTGTHDEIHFREDPFHSNVTGRILALTRRRPQNG